MKRMRVMLADDDSVTLHEIEGFLSRKEDVQIVGAASNGQEAYALAKTIKPDVLVLDIAMPMMDGFHVIKRLKADKIEMRIIILSAFSRDQVIKAAMDLGVYYYLTKPFDYELLYHYIVTEDQFSSHKSARRRPLSIDELDNPDTLVKTSLGIPMTSNGAQHLVTAIRLASQIHGLNGRITKELYPAVAQLHDSTPSRVERVIRHTIQVAWKKGNLMNSGFFPKHKCPSNGLVIATLTERHRQTRRFCRDLPYHS